MTETGTAVVATVSQGIREEGLHHRRSGPVKEEVRPESQRSHDCPDDFIWHFSLQNREVSSIVLRPQFVVSAMRAPGS